ncbi:YhdP family protein [Ruegeria arenilitoris]|uniref:YhdP family protein n=1 Tax=Ruegeria arenilitoris TaxID=1173585 RepID=UPI00346391A3
MDRKLVQHEEKSAAQPEEPPRRRRSRRRKAAHFSGWTVLSLGLLVFAGWFFLFGQNLHAPEWVRHKVEQRLEQSLGGLKFSFGDASFIVNEEWRPRLQLTDVTISDAAGQQIARVSELQTRLSMRGLLRGQIRPRRITVRDAQFDLTRGLDGALSLTVGSGSAPVQEAPDLAQLIEQSDEVFLSPILSGLRSVDLESLTIDFKDLRLGRAWVFDGGHITATRTGDEMHLATGFSVLTGREYASSVEANYTSVLGTPQASFGVAITDLPAEDIASQSLALSWLQVLKAPISGALRGSVDSNSALGPVFATLNLGAGAVQPTQETRPIPFESARTYFTYTPNRKELDFNEVSVVSAWGSFQGEGKAFLDGIETGTLESLTSQLSFSSININPANLFPEPLKLARAELDMQMKLAPFELRLGQIMVADANYRLLGSGKLTGEKDGWAVQVDAHLDNMNADQLLNYWPDRLAPKPRIWVAENLYEGQFSDVDFALRLQPAHKPDIYLDFGFEKAKIRFAKTLPPLENAQGQASLINDRFTATAEKGVVVADKGGAVDATGTSFIIPDTGIKGVSPSITRIAAKGSVTAAMSLLDRPPLELLTKANLPVDLAEGEVDLTGTLALPLKKGLKFEEAEFHFAGEIDDVQSDKLVPGFSVSAARLELVGDQTEVAVSGNGLFGDVPLRATWRQPIGGTEPQRSELTGQIELSPRLMTELKAGLPKGMLTGQGTADIALGIGAGTPPKLTASSDLAGVTLSIPELGWRKGPGTTGTMTVAATLGENLRVDELKLNAAGLRTTASISFRDGDFDRVSFSSFDLGNWLAVPAELVSRGSALPDIRVLGGVMNLGRATFGSSGSGGGSGAGPRLDVTLDRLQITETIALTGFKGDFQTTGGVKGSFTAGVNGGALVRGQVAPRASRSAVTLTSGDAGAVLRSAGMITQARGGSLDLQLEPIAGPGNYDVNVKIKNTRIKDAPAMAALLNAISLVGLLDEMAGQGIYFATIESRMRITPTQVKVLSGSAVGPSMGLSFDGTIDTVSGMLNLRGAISPIYLVNAIGSVFTKKGEGVIGFNYTLTGPLRQPKVTVNPLSGLAPLFLRNLLRAPAPTVSDGPNAQPVKPEEPKRTFGSSAEDR